MHGVETCRMAVRYAAMLQCNGSLVAPPATFFRFRALLVSTCGALADDNKGAQKGITRAVHYDVYDGIYTVPNT